MGIVAQSIRWPTVPSVSADQGDTCVKLYPGPRNKTGGICSIERRLPIWRHLGKIHQRLPFVAIHGILRLPVEAGAGLGGKRNFGEGRSLMQGPLDKLGKSDFSRIRIVVITSRENLPHVSESIMALQNRP